jgi:hypothetical protein
MVINRLQQVPVVGASPAWQESQAGYPIVPGVRRAGVILP